MDDPAVDVELARLQAFIDLVPVDANGYLDGEMRAAQKQASRVRDELLISSGRMTRSEVARRNSWFSGVDFSKVRIASVGGVLYDKLE